MLMSMRTTDTQSTYSQTTYTHTADTQSTVADSTHVFADPVSYLARFGIEASLVETPQPELATAA